MRLHRAGRRAVRFFQRAQGDPQGVGGTPSAAGSNFHAFRRVQTLCGSFYGGAGVYQNRSRTETAENDIPDIISRFHNPDNETSRKRTEQSFFVPKQEIADNDYDLSINKYKKTDYVPVEYPPTSKIMTELHTLEEEITAGLKELEEML